MFVQFPRILKIILVLLKVSEEKCRFPKNKELNPIINISHNLQTLNLILHIF